MCAVVAGTLTKRKETVGAAVISSGGPPHSASSIHTYALSNATAHKGSKSTTLSGSLWLTAF